MLPYINVLGRNISLYGVMVVIGVLAVVSYFKIYEKRYEGKTSADTELTFLFAGVGALIGAKLLYIAVQLPSFLAELPYLFTDTASFMSKYLSAGFVYYGGLYGALAAVWLYGRKNRLSLSGLSRTLAPTIPLFHGFGRIGCFLEGCCYGKPAEGVLPGVVFRRSLIAPNGVSLLPVQLWEAGLEFALFAALARMARRGGDGKTMLAAYLLAYGSARFILEFFRGDAYRGFIGPLSVSQVISIITVLLGSALLRSAHLEKA